MMMKSDRIAPSNCGCGEQELARPQMIAKWSRVVTAHRLRLRAASVTYICMCMYSTCTYIYQRLRNSLKMVLSRRII